MTSPVSGSDSNRSAQNQPSTPSASAEQSAAQAGRNVGQEAAMFQSRFGSGSSATRGIRDDIGSEESSLADSDSSSTQSTQDSDSQQKVTEKKEDKKEGKKDEKKADVKDTQLPTDAQGNVLQQQQPLGQAAIGQKTALPHDASINSIINQVIDKLQVSTPQLNGGQEVRMTLKTPGLGGTEVSITKAGNNLNITFDPKSPEAMKFLAANVAVLQDGLNSKLPNLNVNINVGGQSTQQENNEGRSRGGGDQQGQGQQGQQGQQK